MVDSEVVQALPKNLEALRLCGTSFGQLSLRTLKLHPFYATTLQGLNLDNTFVTGAMALDCLETCAGLVKSVAP